MRRTRVIVASMLVGLAACVPSTKELDPRGAAGFSLEPSAATRGETFETSDGYRVTIDRLVMLASIQAGRIDAPSDDEYHGDSDWVLFDARDPSPVYCPGLPVGEYGLSLVYTELLVDDHEEPAMTPAARAALPRFRAFPDLGRRLVTSDGPFRYGPSVLVDFHAEGHDTHFSASLTLEGSNGFSSGPLGRAQVRANELVTTPVLVQAEELFIHRPLEACGAFCGPRCLSDCLASCPPEAGDPYDCRGHCGTICSEESNPRPRAEFAALARADTDADGILTALELNAAKRAEDAFQSLGADLVDRTSRIMTAPE